MQGRAVYIVEVLMKHILFSLLIFVLVLGCAAPGRAASDGLPGEVFEGTGQGYRGPVTVWVHMSGGSITGITVADSQEDRFVGGAAIEELIDVVIEYNTTDVDAVSGATESSRGFLEAVENAIMGR